jgi:hypothetical protein
MKPLTTRLDLIYRCCGLSSAISKEGYEQRLMLSSKGQLVFQTDRNTFYCKSVAIECHGCSMRRARSRIESRILRAVWGGRHANPLHHFRVAIQALRRKLEPDPAHPPYMLTELGVGYRLETRMYSEVGAQATS